MIFDRRVDVSAKLLITLVSFLALVIRHFLNRKEW